MASDDDMPLAEAAAVVKHAAALEVYETQLRTIGERVDYLSDAEYSRYAELARGDPSRENIDARTRELGVLADEASWRTDKVAPRPKHPEQRMREIRAVLAAAKAGSEKDAEAYKALAPEFQKLVDADAIAAAEKKARENETAEFHVRKGLPYSRAVLAAADAKRAREKEESRD